MTMRDLASEVNRCERLRLIGLMTLPPFFDDPENARPFFRKLAALRDQLKPAAVLSETKR